MSDSCEKCIEVLESKCYHEYVFEFASTSIGR